MIIFYHTYKYKTTNIFEISYKKNSIFKIIQKTITESESKP